ncbi:hypothetical protein HK099_006764 [Clydaea vesicula]|uniref:Uncharacterized protein n=1 Tax=Clydaea vesicula TaxID=447962 RepID=A0AAD5U0V2_9FUNG|nr:hypothetical protein HK099_006764 [Clydaea vesicula]
MTKFFGFAFSQFVSGALVSCIIPSILVYIPNFYIKEEYGKRIVLIFSIGDFCGGLFGNLFSVLIGKLDLNHDNLKSWKM